MKIYFEHSRLELSATTHAPEQVMGQLKKFLVVIK